MQRRKPNHNRFSKPNIFKGLSLALMICFSQMLCAQVDTLSLGSDDLFKVAREEAFNGDRKKAQMYLKAVLTKSPGYSDVRIFLARTYAWDGNRSEARQELQKVLDSEPDNIEAIVALADVENWDDNYLRSLELCNAGLRRQQHNTDLLYRKARALANLNENDKAAQTLQSLFAIEPSHKEGLALMESIKTANIKNNLSINYAEDRFERIFDPFKYQYVQYGRRTKLGSVFARYNGAQRFGTSGHQLELDWYPTIYKSIYAYLNAGLSGTSLFPQYRLGAEIYTKLPWSMEASAGFRYLDFGTDDSSATFLYDNSGVRLSFGNASTVILYTATLGKYIGNYWLDLRTFLTPGDAGLSHSYIFITRRYLQDAENFIGFSAGMGYSPEFLDNDVRDKSIPGAVATLHTRRLGLTYQRTYGRHWLSNVTFNYQKLEPLQDLGNFNTLYGINLVLEYRW